MKNQIKMSSWTQEERDRIVAVFELLISMDKKQNPHLYNKTNNDNKMNMEEITKDEYEQIKTFVCSLNTVSTAIIQYAFKWKYSKAAHVLDVLEKDKIVGPVKYDGEDAYRNVLLYSPQIKKL